MSECEACLYDAAAHCYPGFDSNDSEYPILVW